MATPEQIAFSEALANALGRRGTGIGCLRVNSDAIIEIRLDDDPKWPGIEQWFTWADATEFQHRHVKAIDTWIHLPPPPSNPPPDPGPDPEPPPPPPPPPTTGTAKFGWTWATPLEPTNWGQPLTDVELAAIGGAARSKASHILGWGPTEDLNTLNQYWEARGYPDLMLLAKAPAWAKATNYAYDEQGPMPSAWPRLFDYWAQILAKFKPKRAVLWSEMRGSYPNGFWDLATNRWHPDHYINFWNMGYPILKAASPNTQLGGPYVGISSWGVSSDGTKGLLDARDMKMLSDFIAKCPHDFIAVDGGIDVRPDYTLPPAGTPEQHVEKLLDVLREVRKLSTKPFVWVETYMTGLVNGARVSEHARAWPYLLNEAAKIPGESVWYAWGSQRDMPDLATLRALALRP
jgi:hypothetical protein